MIDKHGTDTYITVEHYIMLASIEEIQYLFNKAVISQRESWNASIATAPDEIFTQIGEKVYLSSLLVESEVLEQAKYTDRPPTKHRSLENALKKYFQTFPGKIRSTDMSEVTKVNFIHRDYNGT